MRIKMNFQIFLISIILLFTLSDGLTSSLIINGNQLISKESSSSPSNVIAALHTEITLNSGALANRINRGPHSSELYLNHFPHRPYNTPSTPQIKSKSLDSSQLAVNQSDVNHLLVDLTQNSKPLLVDKRFAETIINTTTISPDNEKVTVITSTTSSVTTPSPLTHKKGLLPSSTSSSTSSSKSLFTILTGNIIDKSDSIPSRQVSPLIYLSRDPTSPDKYEARGDSLLTDESNSESGIFNGTTRGSNILENDSPPRRGQLREVDSNGGSSNEANPPINYSDTYNRNRYPNMQPTMGNSYGMSSPNVNSYYKYGPSSKPPTQPMSYSNMLSSPFSPSPLSSNIHSGSSYPGNPYSNPNGYSSQYNGFSSPKSPPVPYPLRPINSSEIDAMVAQLRTQLRPKTYTVTNQFANAGLGHNRYQPLTHDYYASSSSARGSLRSNYPLGPSSSLHNSNEGWPSISSPSVSSASSSASQSASTNSGSSSSSASSFMQSPSPLSSSQSSESGSSESGDEESVSGSSGGGNSGQEDSDQPYHTNNYQAAQNQENNNDDNESPSSYPQSNSQAATGPTPTELSSPQFNGNSFASNMLNYGKLTGESGGGFGLGADFTVTSGPDPTSMSLTGGSDPLMAGLSPDSFAHSLGSFPLDSVQSLDPLMGPTGFKSPHEYIHNYYDTEPKEKFRYVGRPGGQEYYNNDYQPSSRPSPYAPQNSMKDFMRVVDSVKHVVYKMKPLKTVASKMYRDFTDKMKKRIKSFRGPPGPVNSIPSPHHQNPHTPQHQQHHHHQHSVPLPHPGLGPSHLGPGGPMSFGIQGIGSSGPFFGQGMGGMGGMGGFNPMALTAMSEMAGMKLPAPPGIGGSNGLGGLTGGGRLKGGLADMLGGSLGGGNSNGDISSLINQYLGMKDGESNNNNNNNNNMDDNLMDELNQALISQLVGGLKLRREDGKNSQESSKANRVREGDLFDEESDTGIDDEDDKEMRKFAADRRSAKDQPKQLFDDTGASNNLQIVSSVGLTNIEQLINSTDSDSHNTHIKNALADGLTMKLIKSPVRLPANDPFSSYTKPKNQSESSKFGLRNKGIHFDKNYGTSESFNLNSTSIEQSSSAEELIALTNSTKQGNKEIKRRKRSSQLFIQHGNSDGRQTLITDDKLSTIVSQGQIVSLTPNGKGNTDKDISSLSQSFGQQLTDAQRAMMSQLLTSSIDDDDSRGTPIKYLDSNDLTMFDHFSANQLQYSNLSDPMIRISDPSEVSLRPYFVYNNDQDQLMELMNEEMSKVPPYESQFPTLIDYMTPDGEIKSDEILKTKLLDLTSQFSFSPGNSLKSSHYSELSPSLPTTPKPDIYLKIIEISPDEPLILDSPVKTSQKSKPQTIQGSSKEQSKVTTINKINERVHFPPTKTTAKSDVKNVWKRFPTPIIWPIGSEVGSKSNNAKPKSSTNHQTKNSPSFGFKLPKTPLPLPTLSPSLIETIKKARLFFHNPTKSPNFGSRSPSSQSSPSLSSQPKSQNSLPSSSPSSQSSSKPLSSLPSYGTSQTSNPSKQALPFSRPPIIFILLKPKQNPVLKTLPNHQQKFYDMIRKSNQKLSPSLLDLSTINQVNLRPSKVNSFNQINKGSSSLISDDSISRLLFPINRKSTDIDSSLGLSTLPHSSQLSHPAIKQSSLSVNNFDLVRAGKIIDNSVRFKSIEPSFSPSTTSSITVPNSKLQSTPETPKKASKFLTDSLWSPTLRKTEDKSSNLKYSQPLESGSTSDSNNLKDHHNNQKEWIPKS